MIQQGLNQLLTQTAYFMQPIGERRRDEKAFNKAQEEANKRVAEIMEITEGAENLTDEQIEYAQNLQTNASKANFERNPTAETLQEWSAASRAKDDVLGQIAEDRWVKNATQQIRQELRYEKLRDRIKKTEGSSTIPDPFKKGGKK